MFELESGAQTRAILASGGWTVLTGVNPTIGRPAQVLVADRQ